MDIKSLIAKAGGPTVVARMFDPPITREAVCQWSKDVPIMRCLTIERATNGAVNRRDMRPKDWYIIWPELDPLRTKRAA